MGTGEEGENKMRRKGWKGKRVKKEQEHRERNKIK